MKQKDELAEIGKQSKRFLHLFSTWERLSPAGKDLIFSWLVGRGEYCISEEDYKKLFEEMRLMNNYSL